MSRDREREGRLDGKAESMPTTTKMSFSLISKTFEAGPPGPGANGPNEYALARVKYSKPMERRSLMNLKQPSAHSSDYGLGRERLNSRCGTRQKSRFKISGSNPKALERPSHDGEMRSKNGGAATVSDRQLPKGSGELGAVDWFHRGDGNHQKHKDVIATIQQSQSLSKAIAEQPQTAYSLQSTYRQDPLHSRSGNREQRKE